MPFPAKFRALIELEESQVTVPDYLWLSYAVCAVEEDSCGWGGWIIESAWKNQGNDEKKVEVEVEADTEQRCPRCNKLLYRTGVEKQYQVNPDAGRKITFLYETTPTEFI